MRRVKPSDEKTTSFWTTELWKSWVVRSRVLGLVNGTSHPLPTPNLFPALMRVLFRIFSVRGDTSPEWKHRSPVQLGVGGPLLSVVVNDDVVDGVIGGGDKGVVGESGHRNLGLGDGSLMGYEMGGTALLGLDPATCWEADRMRCFRAKTGLENPSRPLPELLPVSRGESGVPGVE